MKKYIKPIIETEIFVTNEYIAACQGIDKVACLDMNNAKNVYKDINNNGQIDSGDTILSYRDLLKHDCGTNGDPIAGSHEITDDDLNNLDNRVVVLFNDGTQVPAIMDSDVSQDAPHFISMKNANHS